MYPKTVDMARLTAAVTLPTTTETAILTSPAVVPPSAVQTYRAAFWCQVTVGTGTTSLTIKVYRGGGIGGTPLQTSGLLNVTAGNIVTISWVYVETDVQPDAQQFTFSLTQNAATGAGTVSFATMEVATY